MLSSFLSSESGLSSGGTITGDLTISGDLTVSGSGGFDYSEVLTGDMKITNANATIGLQIEQSGAGHGLKVNQRHSTLGVLIQTDDTHSNPSTGLLKVYNNSSSTSTRNVVDIVQDHVSATGAIPLKIQQDSTEPVTIDHNLSATTTDTARSLFIDFDATGITASGQTATNIGLDLDMNSNAPTMVGTVVNTGIDLDIVGGTSGTQTNVGIDVNVSGADTNYAALFNGGNVGIGTDAPTSALNVEGTFKNRVPFYSTGTAEQSGTTVTGSGTTWVQSLHVGSEFVWADGVSVGKVATRVSNTEITVATARTVSAGTSYSMNYYGITTKDKFVGINTDNPDHLLTIQSSPHYSVSDHVIFKLSSPTYGDYTFNNSGGYLGWQSSGNYNISFDSNDKFQVRTAANNFRFILDDNSRISLSNNDDSGAVGTTLFGYNAGLSIVSGAVENTFIGHAVSDATMTNAADYNTGVGAHALTSLTAGAKNTGLGAYALGAVTDGDFNTAVGVDTLGTNTGADNNTAVGQLAGYATTGADNTYLGFSAGKGGSGAEANNVGVGASALLAVTTGGSNVAIGKSAMVTATTAAENIAIGVSSLESVLSGSGANVAIGYFAMRSVDEGTGGGDADYNIAIGYDALKGGDFASNDRQLQGNVAIGSFAMDATDDNAQTGTVAIGHQSLTALTSGGYNTAVGYQAMTALTTGESNVAIGWQALDAADGGESHNIAIGKAAMGAVDEQSNTSDSNIAIGTGALIGGTGAVLGNIAIGHGSVNATGTNAHTGTIGIGYQALALITSGARNTAIGYQAADGMTTGEDNVAFGYGALGGTSTSSENKRNVAIGSSSMSGTNAGASGNVAIGYAALDANLTAAADSNTAIGYYALSAVTSGDGNVAIGSGAGDALVTGVHNVIIGDESEANATDAGNCIVIGSGAVGQANNSVTLGNADVTAVYMSSDSQALVHSAGIQFAGTQVANAGANVLDDYEEGSWTIAVTCATSGTYTLHSSYDRGEYTKIGRIVHAQGYGSVTSSSSPVGDTRISLPFAAANLTEYAGHTGGTITVFSMDFTGNFYAMEIQEGSQYFRIVEIIDGSGHDYVEGAELAGDFYFNVTYIAA